jgi:hypothetical protein
VHADAAASAREHAAPRAKRNALETGEPTPHALADGLFPWNPARV